MDVSPVKQRRVNRRRWRHVYLTHPSPLTPPPPLYLRLHPHFFVHQPLRSPRPGTDSLPKSAARHRCHGTAEYLQSD